MRICFLSPAAAADRAYHSGCGAKFFEALREEGDARGWTIEHAGPLRLPRAAKLQYRLHCRARTRAGVLPVPEILFPPYINAWVGGARRLLGRREYGAIFCFHSWGALVRPATPTFLMRDAVVPHLAARGSGYPFFENMTLEARAIAARLEERAARDCAGLLVSSRWARDGAIRLCGWEPARVHITGRGSNLVTTPGRLEVTRAIDERLAPGRPLRLLFNGRDWERKGGPKALEVTRLLRERGVDCSLDCVGFTAAERPLPDFATAAGRFDLNDSQDAVRLKDAILGGALLLGLCEGDAYGMMVQDAAACGVPCAVHDVGGLAESAPRDAFTFPRTTPAEEIAATLEPVLQDRAELRRLSLAAFQDSEDRGGWAAVARAALDVAGRVG